jgi:hypothetical protein
MTGPSTILVSIDGSGIVGSLVPQLCTFAHSDDPVSGTSDARAIGYSLLAIGERADD